MEPQIMSKIVVFYVNCFPNSWKNRILFHWQPQKETCFEFIFGISSKVDKPWTIQRSLKIRHLLGKSFDFQEPDHCEIAASNEISVEDLTPNLTPNLTSNKNTNSDIKLKQSSNYKFYLSFHNETKVILTVILLARMKTRSGNYLAFEKDQCNVQHFRKEFIFPIFFQQPKQFIIHTRKRKSKKQLGIFQSSNDGKSGNSAFF